MIDHPPSQGDSGALDAVVDGLRATVAARRAAGEYPPDLEADLAGHFAGIVGRSGSGPRARLELALDALAVAGAFGRHRIMYDSALPGGAAFHRGVGRLVVRQTDAILRQLVEFAAMVHEVLDLMVQVLPREESAALSARVDLALDAVAGVQRDVNPGRLESLEARIAALESLLAPHGGTVG